MSKAPNGKPLKYYSSHGYPSTWAQIREIEVEERGNYEPEDFSKWEEKYGVSASDRVIWVTPNKNMALTYDALAEDRGAILGMSDDGLARYIKDNVYEGADEFTSDMGIIIPESDDGDEGFLFVLRSNLHAPNGKPSNLSEQQWRQVRTPEFLSWFGNWIDDPGNASKIVDENGEPRAVYHGTGTTIDIYDYKYMNMGNDQYNSGFYFTSDYDQAHGYTTRSISGMEKPGGEDNPNVIPVFLNIRNPIIVEAMVTPNLYDVTIPVEITRKLLMNAPNIQNAADSGKPQSILGDWYSEFWEIKGDGNGNILTWDLARFVNRIIRDIGEDNFNLLTVERDFYNDDILSFHEQIRRHLTHDGVHVQYGESLSHYVAWFNNQIKSATENSGAFDLNNPNIRE